MNPFEEEPSGENKQLESQLRDALRAVEPSDAFTEALLAKLASERSIGRARRYSGWWLPASLAAAVLVAVGAGQHLKAAHEREMGLEARREVIEALRVTNQKLDLAYQAVRTQSSALSEGDPGV